MKCPNCGGSIIGDGYTMVLHCENSNADTSCVEPDANVIYCVEPDANVIYCEEVEDGMGFVR